MSEPDRPDDDEQTRPGEPPAAADEAPVEVPPPDEDFAPVVDHGAEDDVPLPVAEPAPDEPAPDEPAPDEPAPDEPAPAEPAPAAEPGELVGSDGEQMAFNEFDPATDPGLDPAAGAAAAPDADEPPTQLVPPARLPSILESLVLASDRPLSTHELAGLVGERDAGKVESALAALAAEYAARGIQLHALAGGWQFRTDPKNSTWVSRLLAHRPVRLTRAQLEALAIIAYRQPITRPEIDDIRGVDSGGTLKTLLERGLIRILGKKEEPGRPMLYGTTREFLEFFHLRDLKDLPTLREFHELTGEHQAQVAALAGAAGVPADAEQPPLTPPTPPPLERVELREDALEDLANIDKLIQEASERAHAAEKQLAQAAELPSTDGAASKPGAPKPEAGPAGK